MNERKEHPCKGCCYAGYVQGVENNYTCDYILIERHKRGCPGGQGCAKKKLGPYIKPEFTYGSKY